MVGVRERGEGMKKTGGAWSREEEKAFENAIALLWGEEESRDRWERMAEMMPNKSVEELRMHFEKLVEDVKAIEAGNVALPSYGGEESTSCSSKESSGIERKPNCSYSSGLGAKGGGSKADQERRKGIPWSEEEHRLFLLGLDKFGKGDWRSISRNFVISRTPTQVASHAQKYFIRMNSINRERRRSSIHDITTINNAVAEPSSHQPPLAAGHHPAPPPSPNTNHRPPHLTMYGTPLGHPVTAAVGTPVMLPPPARPPYVLPLPYPLAR